ncbi:MAG: hypothetical protein KGI75_11425 [Rhizobiaceae bacterium]|nr:hypothetical protein [Rhizobiaceae bacterium]
MIQSEKFGLKVRSPGEDRCPAFKLRWSGREDGKLNGLVFIVTDWLNGCPQLLGDEDAELAWVPFSDIGSLVPLAHPEIISFLQRA